MGVLPCRFTGARFRLAGMATRWRTTPQASCRFDSHATESEALEAAHRLVRQLSERQVVAAGLTNEQAAEYAGASQSLQPFKVNLIAGADTLAKCLGIVPDLTSVLAAISPCTRVMLSARCSSNRTGEPSAASSHTSVHP